MDERLYFVLGDLLANTLAGAIIGWLIWLITPYGWNMWLVMVVAMGLGMVVATLLWLPLNICLGAMEVMLPLMLTGMLAGMVLGMHASMAHFGAGQALFEGAVCGLVSIVIIWILNNSLRGPQQFGREDSHHV
jgi:hypothetical protein